MSSSVGPVLGVNASGYGAHSNTPFRTSVHFQSPHDMATIAEESPPVGGVAPGRRVSSLDDYEKGPYGSVPNPNSFRGANDTLTISQHPDHDKLRRSSGSQDEVTPKRRESNSLSLNSDVDGNKKDNSSSPARRKSVFAALFGSKLFSPPPAAKEVAHIDEADSMPGIPKLDDSYDENEESCSEDSSEMSELNDENIDDGDEVPTPICNPSPTNSIWRRLSLSSGREERTYESGPIERTRNPWTQRKDGGINSRVLLREHGNEIYYVGIIDILQQYNFRKKTENFVKVI